jgi:hypothetical protein
MRQTGHRSADMVRKYIREGSLFRETRAVSGACKLRAAFEYSARGFQERLLGVSFGAGN